MRKTFLLDVFQHKATAIAIQVVEEDLLYAV